MALPLKVQAARTWLMKTRPYVAVALWRVRPVEKPGLGTFAVDRWWRLYYDPAVLDRWTVDEIGGVLYHEIWHLLRDHPRRLEAVDPLLANLAGDAEINDGLLGEGIPLPEGAITPKTLGLPEGRLAEEYLDLLQAKPRRNTGNTAGKAGAASASGGSGESGDGRENPSTGAGASPHGENSHPAPGAGHCGSCATGRPAPWEEPAPDDGGPEGVGEMEAELIRRSVAQAIREAAKTRGDVPASEARWAEEVLRPKVDWRKELAGAIRASLGTVSGAVDYSHSVPARRQAAYGKVIMPAPRQPEPRVAVVVDTSGSMGDQELARAVAEVAGVLQAAGARQGVTVLSTDAAVQVTRQVFRREQVELIGGGGTDMARGIEAAEALNPRPDIIVVITDGLTPWPDHPPKARVIVALTQEDTQSRVPGWAKTIVLDESGP
ncbi:MAG: VWA domain-containing protein [Clostridiales bacterium]|nr:VWA domain-containing protein [Clostridiales bacterium]